MTWIKIHSRIKQWRWYRSSKTKAVFLHLLLLAANERRCGVARATIAQIAEECGETWNCVREILRKLQTSGEIEISREGSNGVPEISICHWEEYQSLTTETTTETTTTIHHHNQARKTANTPPLPTTETTTETTTTSGRAREDIDKENILTDVKENIYIREKEGEERKTTPPPPLPQTWQEVAAIAESKGFRMTADDANAFIYFNRARGWKNVEDWRYLVLNWCKRKAN